jgi:Zn-dependent alcohol dehydrogenase
MSRVQGARICGASKIFTTDPPPAKRAPPLDLCTTDAVDPGEGDMTGQVRAANRGEGVDYAFEVVSRLS